MFFVSRDRLRGSHAPREAMVHAIMRALDEPSAPVLGFTLPSSNRRPPRDACTRSPSPQALETVFDAESFFLALIFFFSQVEHDDAASLPIAMAPLRDRF